MPQYLFINKEGKWIGQLKTKPINYPYGYNAEFFQFKNRHEANGFAKALNLLFKESYKALTLTEAKKIIDKTK